MAKKYSRLVYRISIGTIFFLLGLCFSSWASRIPSIRQRLHLTDSMLGVVLFALPVGSFLSLFISGWVINKWGSRIIVITATFLYGLLLLTLGLSATTLELITCLFFFGWIGNTINISVNTQALGVQQMYGKSIMAYFHGLWSLAGFTGAAIGTFMIGKNIYPSYHFMLIAIIVTVVLLICSNYTLREDINKKENSGFFSKPDKPLLSLGAIAFCSMICEGAMFDWSGIYFQKVVLVDRSMIGAGYSAFMSTMAAGRFIADWFSNKFGLKRTLQLSGFLICSGLLLAVLLPKLITALIGFFLVGFGVCSVVPLVYGLAGKSKTLSAGAALATVSTIGFIGFLLGPPIIGLLAGAFSLRISFTLIAIMGLLVSIVSTGVMKEVKK